MNLSLAAIDGYMLVGFWKALIVLIPFTAWAWFVSSVLDKHAARFFLPRERWNLIHLIAGLIALGLVFGMPIRAEWGFWVGLAAMMAVLAIDITAYVVISSRDERVPEEHHIRLDLSSWKQARVEKAAAKHQGTVELTIVGARGQKVPPPDAESPEFAVRVAAEGLLTTAIDARASQADLIPAGESRYGLSLTVDGVRQAGGEPMAAADAAKLIDFWKSAAGLDLSDRRRRQWGDIKVSRDGVERVIRVYSSGGQAGLRLTLKLDAAKAVRRDADDLGMLPAQYAELEAMAKEDQGGIVLLAAPPHNGRTTTLYSVLRLHDAYTSNVQTLEIEPQDEIEGVRQNRFDPYAEGPEFSTMLRSILRRDPDVVGVAETPDTKTLNEACKGDQERSRTYISVRGDSAIGVIQAFLKGVGDNECGNALHGVLAQKLVRRLCSNCRVPYQPQPETVRKLGLPPDKVKQLYKKGGQVLIKNKPDICPVCSGTGFTGQVGVFEVYRITPAERALLAKGDLKAVAAEFKKRKLPTLQQAALIRATEGVTSVEEVIRISAPPSAPGAARPKQAEPAPSA